MTPFGNNKFQQFRKYFLRYRNCDLLREFVSFSVFPRKTTYVINHDNNVLVKLQALFQLCSSGVLLQRVGRRDSLGTKLSLKNLSDGVTLPPFYTHHVIKSEVSILIHLVDFPFTCTFFASTFLPFLPR